MINALVLVNLAKRIVVKIVRAQIARAKDVTARTK